MLDVVLSSQLVFALFSQLLSEFWAFLSGQVGLIRSDAILMVFHLSWFWFWLLDQLPTRCRRCAPSSPGLALAADRTGSGGTDQSGGVQQLSCCCRRKPRENRGLTGEQRQRQRNQWEQRGCLTRSTQQNRHVTAQISSSNKHNRKKTNQPLINGLFQKERLNFLWLIKWITWVVDVKLNFCVPSGKYN